MTCTLNQSAKEPAKADGQRLMAKRSKRHVSNFGNVLNSCFNVNSVDTTKCNVLKLKTIQVERNLLKGQLIGKTSVYKHYFCYSNVPTTGTKDPLFRQPMRFWLAH